ncbi:transposase [Hymenobacter sp. IS2118]|uniref:transposase n=1 Tax=Hymenobacter sp. IS2118 TaxID=1505605 RepID=UPI0005594401|nr:transposase [Hymenobacter sp. IS2118]
MKTIYQRNLPHILPPGGTVFITFRLAGSIAAVVVQRLADERERAIAEACVQLALPQARAKAVYDIRKAHFARYDAVLDRAADGPTWLNDKRIANLVAQEILRLDELDIIVLAYCIMANHVHVVLQLPDSVGFSPAKMMQRLKGRTALEANKLLHRQGEPFWRHESYDHLVRDGKEAERVIAYVLNNPVKSGLVAEWTQWPYSFVR